jgi:hypothetical protein
VNVPIQNAMNVIEDNPMQHNIIVLNHNPIQHISENASDITTNSAPSNIAAFNDEMELCDQAFQEYINMPRSGPPTPSQPLIPSNYSQRPLSPPLTLEQQAAFFDEDDF